MASFSEKLKRWIAPFGLTGANPVDNGKKWALFILTLLSESLVNFEWDRRVEWVCVIAREGVNIAMEFVFMQYKNQRFQLIWVLLKCT